jgi:hypothetical protein
VPTVIMFAGPGASYQRCACRAKEAAARKHKKRVCSAQLTTGCSYGPAARQLPRAEAPGRRPGCGTHGARSRAPSAAWPAARGARQRRSCSAAALCSPAAFPSASQPAPRRRPGAPARGAPARRRAATARRRRRCAQIRGPEAPRAARSRSR